MKLEWTKSSGKEDIYAIYIDRGGAKYPLATIEFAPALGRDDLERLFRTAPELLEACHKALDGMYNQYPQYETMSCEALQHPDMDCHAVEVILDIRAAIAKAEGEQ